MLPKHYLDQLTEGIFDMTENVLQLRSYNMTAAEEPALIDFRRNFVIRSERRERVVLRASCRMAISIMRIVESSLLPARSENGKTILEKQPICMKKRDFPVAISRACLNN